MKLDASERCRVASPAMFNRQSWREKFKSFSKDIEISQPISFQYIHYFHIQNACLSTLQIYLKVPQSIR